jgi:predicted dehydrogenase
MTSLEGCRVAIIGARGIGKHHAKWWALEGAEVVAFAGTSPDSVEATADGLKDLFEFRGKGYTSVAAMLEEESPDVVDVCSPAPWHYAHVQAALLHGSHVLCEKPFVYDARLEREEILGQARELVALAETRHALLGICTQCVAAMDAFMELWREQRGDEAIERFEVELASPDRGKHPTIRDIWVDLAPHPLSMLQVLASGVAIDWSSVRGEAAERSCTAAFEAATGDGRRLAGSIRVGKTVGEPTHVWKVSLNGYAFEVEAQRDSAGIYCARISTPDVVREYPDFMRMMIRAFLSGQPAADGAMAVQNLEWLLGFMDLFPPRPRGAVS